MNEWMRQLIAGLAAGAGLAVMVLWADFVFWFGALLSGAVGLGTYFMIPRRKEPHEIEVAPGITQAQLDHVIAGIEEYNGKFTALAREYPHGKMADRIREIVEIMGKIARHFQKDPASLANATVFLDQYLEKSHDILSGYLELIRLDAGRLPKDKLKRVEQTLERIHSGFDDFYHRCIAEDFMDLEARAEALEAIIDIDMPES